MTRSRSEWRLQWVSLRAMVRTILVACLLQLGSTTASAGQAPPAPPPSAPTQTLETTLAELRKLIEQQQTALELQGRLMQGF